MTTPVGVGIDVTPFGVPTDEELTHDFLWRGARTHAGDGDDRRLQPQPRRRRPGGAGQGLAPEPARRRRDAHIRNFERLPVDEGTHVVKRYLNVSKEEQRERLQDRVEDPHERW